MMKLCTMRDIVDTLTDQGTSPLADEIASRWSPDPGSVRFLRASANFVFTFTASGKKYVLRFNHADERTREHVQAEVDYLQYLASAGMYVAKPIPSLSGNDVESVQTSYGVFHAVVFEALSGTQFEIDELTSDMFRAWGRALAELHQASESYKTAGRLTWHDHLVWAETMLPIGEEAARNELARLMTELGALPMNVSNFGLIHYDFELDNLVWSGDRLGMIDFDDSAYYWFVADIAFALRDLVDPNVEHLDFNNASLLTFVDGYRMVRSVSREDIQRIPLFLQMHNLIMFCKLIRALEPCDEADEAEWVTGLRQKLILKVEAYRGGFAQNAAVS